MDQASESLMSSLVWFDVLGYAPTWIEWLTQSGQGERWDAARSLIDERLVMEHRGRVHFPGRESLVDEHESRTRFMPRKLRVARRVASWLSRLEGVRFVALCNTTAMSHAKDESDLDFFVITKAGSLWQTRGFAALPFKLFGGRPNAGDERDAVCLSFFIDDQALDLSNLMLERDDPYFRSWFLNLLPLFDDGVSLDLWKANSSITSRHSALRWIMHPQLEVRSKRIRVPFIRSLDAVAQRLQERAFPVTIKQRMNQGTDVVADEHRIKLHVSDGRRAYREAYETRCRSLGISP